MTILNLGCGTKTSKNKNVINIDWSAYLRIRKNPILSFFAPIFLKGERFERYKSLSQNILVHDLRKGIPFESGTVDAVYHSHVLEHIDRNFVDTFLLEIKRVLKPGGILRIVVPDMENLCREYISHIDICEKNIQEIDSHDQYISNILEQSVRRDAHGTEKQNIFRKTIERMLLGDARKRGETHQWMYDRFNLRNILEKLGFDSIELKDFNNSNIPDWNSYSLEVDENGKEYKPGSLYIETVK